MEQSATGNEDVITDTRTVLSQAENLDVSTYSYYSSAQPS